ncbi:hypothetical protein BDN70DRAFT_887667, partial [Pholiota conissans]
VCTRWLCCILRCHRICPRHRRGHELYNIPLYMPENGPMGKYRNTPSRVCTISSLYSGQHVM